jgi:hypothetical protein
MARLLIIFALIVSGCSDDNTTADSGVAKDGATKDGATRDLSRQDASRDGAAKDIAGDQSGLCGGQVCSAGFACCGPPACGFCTPENSGVYCPPSCPDAGTSACGQTPSGFCDPGAVKPCIDGVRTCRCEAVCSGPQPPPGQEYAWKCKTPRDPRCPTRSPSEGSACSHAGLVCNYVTCGGSIATCTAGKWAVQTISPPP